MKRRHLHNLSHYRLATFDMGELVPVACMEVLPGQSVQKASSVLMRVSPLLAPVMHPISVRMHDFFVPYRLLWTGWQDFITGGNDGAGDSSGAFPTITVNTGTGWAEGSLADYLGVPTGVDDIPVSALPFRAYATIYNTFFRDQDLQSALTVSTASGADTTTSTTLQKICWEKDGFTAARAWPQRGDAVTLPLGTTATIKTNATDLVTGAQNPLKMRHTVDGSLPGATKSLAIDTNGDIFYNDTAPGANAKDVYPTNLYADLANATAADVSDIRRAFALQRYAEARAMYGAEYVDYLKYAFGVTSSDARLQRPEYLGGGKATISFSEVLQTGPDASDDGVGTLRGHGIAALRSRRFRRYFEEHGVVISLMSVRPRSMYMDGLHRSWSRTTKEDFYQPELEAIGQQEVLNKEVYAAHATPTGVFGYNDRYAEYRHIPSHISGEFRSTLNMWHLARDFSSDPALNSTFVTCTPGKRIHADTSGDQLWTMVSHSIKTRSPVAPPGVPRIF